MSIIIYFTCNMRLKHQKRVYNRLFSFIFLYTKFNIFQWSDVINLKYKILFKILRDSIDGFKHIDEKLGNWDLVTEYDRKIENVIIGELKRAFPNHR